MKKCAAIVATFRTAACVCLGSVVAGAQQPATPPYVCPVHGPAQVPPADPLAFRGWTTSGEFTDPRAVGIDSHRNRVVVSHGGLDLVGTKGNQVVAVLDGRVAVASTWTHLGMTVVIDHGIGIYSVYAFLGTLDVVEGEQVQHGRPVGTIGFSGDAAAVERENAAAAPRVHFALLRAAHAGLADAGQPLRQLSDAADAWTPHVDSIASAVDPRTLLPPGCIEAAK